MTRCCPTALPGGSGGLRPGGPRGRHGASTSAASRSPPCGRAWGQRSIRRMGKVVRVANASGYWGDDPEALARQVRGDPVDYVTLDFLAEITMVILERQRARNPNLGYAYDFVQMLSPLLPVLVERGIRVVANAGGVNVTACRDRIAEACRAQGVTPALGLVCGDDLLPRLDELLGAGIPLAHLDDGRPLG